MHTMRFSRRAAVRTAAIAVAALAAALGGNVSAQAADGDGIAGYQSAQQTLTTDQVRSTVSRFLVAAKQQPGTAAAADGGTGNAPAAVAAPPRFELKDPVPMFELSPDFVAGKAKADPQTALQLSYLASRVTASDGHQAAVLLAPKGNTSATPGNGAQNVGSEGWQLAGIRDGDTEIALAERGTPQARTFTEPQIHAWYRLTADGTVEPLNEEATSGLGGKRSLPLAAYQKLVTTRYGDKMPGSEYDRKGLAGGYDGLVDGEPAPAAQPAQAAAETAAGIPASGASWRPAVVAGATALAAVGGVAVFANRRRRAAEAG